MVKSNKKFIFIGAAWPYANAPLHLGHIASLLPADIIARYYRERGDSVLFVSGSDCYGTPIVIAAANENKKPKEISDYYHNQFKKTLTEGFDFSYDIYTTTLTDNHSKVVQEFFTKLYNGGEIISKEQELPYCPKCKRFLPDRYIEGTCSKCGFINARGDQCDECGAILDAIELIDPKCKICSTTPIFKKSVHFFLKLSGKEDFIRSLVDNSKGWRNNAIGFTKKLINEKFQDRAITRDTNWGVDIPLKGYEDKKIYVWFDAVCGYLSASKELLKNNGWENYWKNSDSIHYYVHGKDNIPFHTIIWPVMLKGFGGLKLPDRIISSEYLTLEKKQFSKSRNWAVWADEISKVFDSDCLRYYLIINGPENSDSDFTFSDFQKRINNELIGNFANFINRTAQLISNNFSSGVSMKNKSEYLIQVESQISEIQKQIELGNLKDALKKIIKFAEDGNKYLAKEEPWKSINTDNELAENTLANCSYVIETINGLLKPFLPKTADKISSIFIRENSCWKVKDVKVLFNKIEDAIIEKQIKKLESAKRKGKQI